MISGVDPEAQEYSCAVDSADCCIVNLAEVDCDVVGHTFFEERQRPGNRYRGAGSDSGLVFSSPSGFESEAVAGCPAPACSALVSIR